MVAYRAFASTLHSNAASSRPKWRTVCAWHRANAVSWGIVDGLVVPNTLWLVVIFWVAPAVATLGLGIMVRVSARCRTTQEANQLGGAVILPLIFVAVGQSTGLLLVDVPVALGIGAVIWAVAIALVARGAQLFTRDRVAGRA